MKLQLKQRIHSITKHMQTFIILALMITTTAFGMQVTTQTPTVDAECKEIVPYNQPSEIVPYHQPAVTDLYHDQSEEGISDHWAICALVDEALTKAAHGNLLPKNVLIFIINYLSTPQAQIPEERIHPLSRKLSIKNITQLNQCQDASCRFSHIMSLTALPNNRLAALSYDSCHNAVQTHRIVRIWNYVSGKILHKISPSDSPVTSILCLDNDTLAITTAEGEETGRQKRPKYGIISLWSLRDYSKIGKMTNPGSVRCLICLPGKRLVVGLQAGKLQTGRMNIWNYQTQQCEVAVNPDSAEQCKQTCRINTLRGNVMCLLQLSSNMVVIATNKPKIIVFDCTNMQSETIDGHEDGITQLVKLSNQEQDQKFASASWDKTIKVWDKEGKSFACIRTIWNPNPVTSMLRIADNYLAVGMESPTDTMSIRLVEPEIMFQRDSDCQGGDMTVLTDGTTILIKAHNTKTGDYNFHILDTTLGKSFQAQQPVSCVVALADQTFAEAGLGIGIIEVHKLQSE